MITRLTLRHLMLRHTQRMRTKVILTRHTRTRVIHIIIPTVIHTAMGILIGRIIHALGFTHFIVVFMGGSVIQDTMVTTIITITAITMAILGAYTPMVRGTQVSLRTVQVSHGARPVVLGISILMAVAR